MSGSATTFEDSRRRDPRSDRSQSAPDGDAASHADWGVPGEKSGMSREMKIGLLLILVLAGAFGYVVYRKIQNANEFPDGDGVATTSDRTHRRNRRVEALPSTHDGSQTTSDTDGQARRRRNGGATTSAQGEPPFGGSRDDGSQPGGNPFQATSSSSARDGSATTRDHSTGKVRVGGFPSGQSEPGPGGNPFAGDVAKSGSATTTDTGSKSAGPWDLNGNKSSTAGTDGSATTGGNPFAGVNGSATTTDRGTTTGDGFQNADSRDPRSGNPFGRRPRSAGTRRGDFNSDGRNEPPKAVFGGNFEPSGSATTTDSRRGQPQPLDGGDSRLGPYRFATDQRHRAGSTTTVQAGGADDQPFGQQPGNGSATTTDTGSTNSGFADGGATSRDNRRSISTSAGTPATLDGQDIQYGNDRPRVHVVGYGDNYWSISRQVYGAGRYFQVLAEYNRHRIPDPKRLRPGMKVLVPTIDVLAARFPKLCPIRQTSQGFSKIPGMSGQHGGFFRDRSGSPMFRVGSTDTLSEIAQQHLGRSSRWIQIYHMNRERIPNPNRLTIGTELRLPADASNIRVVRGGREFR